MTFSTASFISASLIFPSPFRLRLPGSGYT